MDIVRGERPRPLDTRLVAVLLDRGRHDPGRADAVAAHDQDLLGAVLVEERSPERLRVLRLELEDMADLDRHLQMEVSAALRARVSFVNLPQVREPRLEAAAGLDPGERDVSTVAPAPVLPPPQPLSPISLDGAPARADRPAARPEGLTDLLLLGRAEVV